MSIAVALNIPILVVVTKIDIAPKDVLKNTRRKLAQLLRGNGLTPFPIKSEESVTEALDHLFPPLSSVPFSLLFSFFTLFFFLG